VTRTCGECSLCCKLLAVRELRKSAGERCRYQSFSKGCGVYKTQAMPNSCKLWSCRWLVQEADTRDLSRPDRSGVVLDILPDYITAIDNETGAETKIEVVQVWVDPKRPDAHRDPALRAYLEHQAEQGIAALVRYNAIDGFVLAAPSMANGVWLEMRTQREAVEHSAADIAEALGGTYEMTVEASP